MSWQATLFNSFMRVNKFYLSGKDFTQAKKAMKKMADKPAEKADYPVDAVVKKVSLDGVNCEWVYDKSVSSETLKVIVYFHGGGFYAGSPATHRDAAHRLSLATGMKLLVVDYRLAPEHIFPAALEDGMTAYQWLLSNDYKSEDIAFGGDSAGGNMTLSIMQLLRQQGSKLPFAGFCVSPWADLSHSGDSWISNQRKDVMIPHSLLENAAPVYAGQKSLDDPLVSPVFADFTGFPPIYLIAGENEVLVDDANRIYQRATQANVKAEIKIWPRMPHAFTSIANFIPEGREAIQDIANFLSRAYQQ